MTRPDKKTMLAWTAMLAAQPQLCSGFQGMMTPGRAGAIRIEKAAGRTTFTSSSTVAPSQDSKRNGDVACKMSLFDSFSSSSLVGGDSLLGSIFGTTPVEETTLPNDPEADTKARKKQLLEQQKLYQWRLGGTPIDMPYLEGFPPDEQLPTFEWMRKTAAVVVRILLGTVRGTVGAGEVIEALVDPRKAKNFAQRLNELIGAAKTNERPVDMDDYNDLHAFPVKTPESLWDYDEDDAFARQRLQGANAVLIEKCTEVTRKKLFLLDRDSEYAELKKKVDTLMAEGKLFAVDHELLVHMKSSNYDETPRYLAEGIALFEKTEDELLPLKPIGIQLNQGYTKNPAPIFTPEDGYNWKIATSCFEASDFIIHEVVSHLGNTHVVMEAPMVALNRQLPSEHPIFALLTPHVEGTALINWGAHELLMAEGGGVDKLTANRIEDSWDMVKEQTLKRISKDFSPEADFEARGMTKEDFPGRYPYRDYGLKYWDAIHAWVTDYLNIYYTSQTKLDGDYELEAFVTELVDVGKHTWLEGWVSMKDFEAKKALLAKYLSSLIYTASALHAAVNFPQQPLTSYVPNTPAAVYQPYPTDKEPRSFQDYLDYLPHIELATTQVVLTTLLGSIIYTKIGDYEADQFTDDRVREPLQKFQQAIEHIETDIIDENAYVTHCWKGRGKDKKDAANFAYKILLPDNVPQSINI